MKLKIKVTKDILERSKMCSTMIGENCAIALAVRDIFPNAWVEEADIMPHFPKQNFSEYIPLPLSAKMFIEQFDKKISRRKIIYERDGV